MDVFYGNNDPNHRIRPVNGIRDHFQIACNDMKLCVSIINYFDNRASLWKSIDGEQSALENTYGVISPNPVLQNINDFVIDKASSEDEELSGECVSFEPEVYAEKHIQLLKV